MERVEHVEVDCREALYKSQVGERIGQQGERTVRVGWGARLRQARLGRKLKVDGLWLHDLRASFVTRKMREGRDRELIKMFTGHRTDHAFRRYSRPTLEDLKAVILAPQWPQEKERKAETSVSR